MFFELAVVAAAATDGAPSSVLADARAIVIGVPRPDETGGSPRLDVYVAAGHGSIFEFGKLTPAAVSLGFRGATPATVVGAPPGSIAKVDSSGSPPVVSILRISPAGLPASGRLCTVTFAAGSAQGVIEIAYDRPESTWVEVGASASATRVSFATGNGPGFVVLSGRDRERQVRIFAQLDHVRSLQLAFNGPAAGERALVRPRSSYTTSKQTQVSAFSGGRRIGWGCFSPPFMIPSGEVLGVLTFSVPFSLHHFDLASSDALVESKAFKPLEMVVVDGGGAFLGGDEVALHAHDEL